MARPISCSHLAIQRIHENQLRGGGVCASGLELSFPLRIPERRNSAG